MHSLVVCLSVSFSVSQSLSMCFGRSLFSLSLECERENIHHILHCVVVDV